MAKQSKKIESSPISEFGANPTALSGGYILYGEEDYLKRYYFEKVKKVLVDEHDVFNYLEMTSENYSASSLVGFLEALPIMAERKVLVLSEMEPIFAQKDSFEQLCEVLSTTENYPETVTIVYLLSGEGNDTVISKLSSVLKPFESKRENPAKVMKWAAKHFSENGVFADADCCKKLVENCNCDMYMVAGEISKLSAYVKMQGRERLEMKDVIGLTPDTFEATAFGLTNAITSGDTKYALQIINDCKTKKEKEELILAGITSTVCDMYAIKLYQEKNIPISVIASELKWHEYKTKLLYKSVSGLKIERLESIISLCRNADLMIKSGTTDKYLIIERLASEATIR